MRTTFSHEFQKYVRRIPEKEHEWLNERLALFRTTPFHPLLRNHRLHGPLEGLRSISITGDMRALYYLIDPDHAHFVAAGTHSQLYG